ncbi:hypothetical protein VFPPC_02580 [Pochonia chlamydosporia 170]|uniref:Uncharacterized protein n=1 Tax=Pochonia chlamydosporia 170 TaxID=1380566 RepID=A0A179FWK4_METCM|nr:hypothetical protein VFPPC_02580 [Pochonia chlamydosporia 170]OAQ70046.1 hypothetical protein VFPPC_02580 [Pochonia chlamydosporia 170]
MAQNSKTVKTSPSWRHIRVGPHPFPGDLDKINAQWMDARRPMMDAFFQYVYADKTGAANVVACLRGGAEYRVCNLLMKKGLNFVYQEEFAYLVDEKLWGKFWDDANASGLVAKDLDNPKWPWSHVKSLTKQGEISRHYDAYLTKKRQPPVYTSSATQTIEGNPKPVSKVRYCRTQVKDSCDERWKTIKTEVWGDDGDWTNAQSVLGWPDGRKPKRAKREEVEALSEPVSQRGVISAREG